MFLTILRVRCKECGKTHAVLPSFVVPYLHEPIIDLQIIVVTGYTKENIDHTRSIRKIRAKWPPMLRTLGFIIQDKLIDMCSKITHMFKQCFMQLHKGFYYLISTNHAT